MYSDGLVWSDHEFGGTAYLTAGQTNFSRSFRRIDKATKEAIACTTPPQMTFGTYIITSVLSADSMYASFILTPEQSNAAIAAREMAWLDNGRRIGRITVKGTY